MLGLFVRNHAKAVSELCDVSVIYTHADHTLKKNEYLIESAIDADLREIIVYYKKGSCSIPLLSQLIKSGRFLKAFSKGYKFLLQNSGSPDLVHANILTRTAVLALRLKNKYNIPYIITEHWSRYLPGRSEYKGFWRKRITEKVVRNAFAVTTVTENLKNAMIACGLKHVNYQVVPNVVDTERFTPEIKCIHEKKIITHISCFDEAAKNVKAIVRLAKNLSQVRNDFEIHLVGDGVDKEMVYNYAKELGVIDSVVFFDGLQENEILVDSINNSVFTLLFSNYENFPVVIPESISCGIPVLSSDVGGIAEHLSGDLGILVTRGNEEELFEKANFLLDHYSEFSSEKLRNYAVTHFSNKVVANQFYAIYLNALKNT